MEETPEPEPQETPAQSQPVVQPTSRPAMGYCGIWSNLVTMALCLLWGLGCLLASVPEYYQSVFVGFCLIAIVNAFSFAYEVGRESGFFQGRG